MKIRVFSDIHWEHDMNIKMKTNSEHRFWEPIPLEDDKDTTLILAGDLWNGEKSIDQIEEFHKRFLRVIVVFGNHDCVDSKTELLTKRGFVHYLDIRDNDEVLTLDSNGYSVWNKINNIIIKKYSGKMITLEENKLEFNVTQNHRIFFSRERASKNIYCDNYGNLPNKIFIPVSGHSYNTDYDISDNMLELIGLCITDGSIKFNRINIYQSKIHVVERIRYLLKSLGIEYSEYSRQRNTTHIYGKELKNKPLISYEFGLNLVESKKILDYDISKMYFPKFFSLLSERQFSVLLRGICLGDGNMKNNHYTIYKDKQFLERLQILCVQFGYKSTIKKYREDSWKLYITKTEKLQYYKSKSIIETEYDGDVWCLNVDNSNFMVRRNGKCHFTGNCWYNNHTLLYSLYKQELEFRGMNNVFLLNRDSLTFGDDIFVGCTLWTNMDDYNPHAISGAPQIMYPDFNLIKIAEEFNTETHMFDRKKMNQEYWLLQNQLDFDYIKHIIKNNKDKNIHVITHYGCSARSIHQRFKEYGLSNYFFVNEYDEFIEDNVNIRTWIHGHVHNKFNYHIGNCNVIVNPRGYPTPKGMENPEFDEISLYEIYYNK